MKKLLIAIHIFLVVNILTAQDTVVLQHKFYTSTFIKSKHIPLLVEYTLTGEMVNCQSKIKRNDKFTPDPLLLEATDLLSDYKGCGFDRGHNMSAADNSCNDTGMVECFYFSNMFPQTHSLNAGPWKTLEIKARDEAKEYGKIKIFIGSIGTQGKIGKSQVVVPQYCWKIIYIQSIATYECYIFPNSKIENKNYESYKVPLSEIEKLSHIKFECDRAIIE